MYFFLFLLASLSELKLGWVWVSWIIKKKFFFIHYRPWVMVYGSNFVVVNKCFLDSFKKVFWPIKKFLDAVLVCVLTLFNTSKKSLMWFGPFIKKIVLESKWSFLGGYDLKIQKFTLIRLQMSPKFARNTNFAWRIQKNWSHDDLLTPQIPNWVVLRKNDS